MLPQRIWILEALWTDSLENEMSAAFGYQIVGYVTDEYVAEKLVDAMGWEDGTGWPIAKGQKMPRLRGRAIERINLTVGLKPAASSILDALKRAGDHQKFPAPGKPMGAPDKSSRVTPALDSPTKERP